MKQTTLAACLSGILTLGIVAPTLAADDITITRPEHNMASRAYMGASFGSANYDKLNDTSAAFALFGGYNLNEVLALELGYTNLGTAKKSGVEGKASALSLDVLGKVPVRSDLTLFGKVGLSSWSMDVSPGSVSDSAIDVSYGIGADYDISGSTAVRFAADFYSLSGSKIDENVNVFSIGFVYKL